MLDSITESLTKILQNIWHAMFVVPFKYWSDWFVQILQCAADFYAKIIGEHVLNFSDLFTPPGEMPPELKTTIDGCLKEGTVGGVIAGLFYLLPWLSGYMLNTYGVINKDALRDVMALYTPSLLEPNHLISLLWRYPDKEEMINQTFKWLGYDEDTQANIIKAMKPLLQPEDLMQLKRRGKIEPKYYEDHMKAYGYDDDEVKHFIELGNVIPNISDLIRMAVREVFTPAIVEKFGQDEGYPAELTEHAKAQGLSLEWSKRFWAAHWDLPSVQMGYEMLHRKIIDPETLDMLMKALDIMPYWRDKLKEMSYKPYTRVDVRRMYAAHVLEEEDVYEAYKAVGYNEERALKMTEFTVKWTEPKEKDLTKTELTDSLKKTLIKERECHEKLMLLGYDSDEADLLIARAQYEKEKDKKELSLSAVKRLYIAGEYGTQDVYDRLGRLNLEGNEAADLITLWDIDKDSKIKQLSSKELKDMLVADVLKTNEWIVEMKKVGYQDHNIRLIYHLVKGEKMP